MQATGPAIRVTHDFRTHHGHGETGVCNVLGKHTWRLATCPTGKVWRCVYCPTSCGPVR